MAARNGTAPSSSSSSSAPRTDPALVFDVQLRLHVRLQLSFISSVDPALLHYLLDGNNKDQNLLRRSEFWGPKSSMVTIRRNAHYHTDAEVLMVGPELEMDPQNQKPQNRKYRADTD